MAESAWPAVRRHLSEVRARDPARNHAALADILDACHEALGESYAALRVRELGVHTARLRAMSETAGDFLLPADAADLRALHFNLRMFVRQYPDWREYEAESSVALGSPEAEERAARATAAALEVIEGAVPDILAPDIKESLDALKAAAVSKPDGEEVDPVVRRAFLGTAREAFRVLVRDALSEALERARRGVGRDARQRAVEGLRPALDIIFWLATEVPGLFSAIAAVVPYLRRLLRKGEESADKGGEER